MTNLLSIEYNNCLMFDPRFTRNNRFQALVPIFFVVVLEIGIQIQVINSGQVTRLNRTDEDDYGKAFDIEIYDSSNQVYRRKRSIYWCYFGSSQKTCFKTIT